MARTLGFGIKPNRSFSDCGVLGVRVIGRRLAKCVIVMFVVAGCRATPDDAGQPTTGRTSGLRLTSSAFNPQSEIPIEFTCDGRNISPQLSWSGAPAGTRSFALIMHDPDAPMPGGYTHWLVYNVPSSVDRIPENAPNQNQLPGGGIQGKNSAGEYGYTGPCPPSGTHRYYFILYALDSALDPSAGLNKDALEKLIEGHILAKAELMGRRQARVRESRVTASSARARRW